MGLENGMGREVWDVDLLWGLVRGFVVLVRSCSFSLWLLRGVKNRLKDCLFGFMMRSMGLMG